MHAAQLAMHGSQVPVAEFVKVPLVQSDTHRTGLDVPCTRNVSSLHSMQPISSHWEH